jgi:hypothetical protein
MPHLALFIALPTLLLGQTKSSWGGTISGGVDVTPATMELAIDGSGTMSGKISGPKIQPGIVSGTRDTKTGAVKFDVKLEGGDNAGVYAFTGKIANDTLSATTTLPNGRFFRMSLIKGAKAPPIVASVPQNPSDPALAAAQRGFTEVSGWLSRAAAMVPPEKYTYKPVGTVRSFGELIGHVADGYTYYCARAGGKEVQWSDAIEKGPKDKATLAAKLKTAQDACTAAYAKGQVGPLFENVAHSNLHYGNVITYMRMMGLTPPSS